jgi:hypothetical protein
MREDDHIAEREDWRTYGGGALGRHARKIRRVPPAGERLLALRRTALALLAV